MPRFRVLGASFSIFACFVFEIWVLHFRDLGASFSRFGYFVFEMWVLRASIFVFECFVFETTIRASVFVFETTIYLTYILYGICVNIFIMNWYISKSYTRSKNTIYRAGVAVVSTITS